MTAPTLTEFLLARIAEDEEVAIAAQRHPADGPPERWQSGRGAHEDRHFYSAAVDLPSIGSHPDYPMVKAVDASTARHIARHDPARVLAECEARRRIVSLHTPVDDQPDGWCNHCDGDGWPCGTMAALSSVYADHPDYDEAWRP